MWILDNSYPVDKVKDCTAANRSEETYPRLYATEAAQLFITRFLPFGYEAVDEICQI